MIPTDILRYKHNEHDGELRLGWASWDPGSYTRRSIKYAYRDQGGKISRGSPEIPMEMLLDMVIFAAEHGELDADPQLRTAYEKLESRLKRIDLKAE